MGSMNTGWLESSWSGSQSCLDIQLNVKCMSPWVDGMQKAENLDGASEEEVHGTSVLVLAQTVPQLLDIESDYIL